MPGLLRQTEPKSGKEQSSGLSLSKSGARSLGDALLLPFPLCSSPALHISGPLSRFRVWKP